jgi:transcriptional regulator with XRE-family HTH domain
MECKKEATPKDNLAKIIGQRLKDLRKTHDGLAQGQVAEAIGVTKQAVNSYENGRRVPDLAYLRALALYYNCSMDYLFGFSDKPVREDKELSNVPYIQRFLDSLQRLSDEGCEPLLTSFTHITDSLALDKFNPRRREFIEAVGELNVACADYIEMSGKVSECVPKKVIDNNTSLIANDDLIERFATLIAFNLIDEIGKEIKEIGIDAMFHFSVNARKTVSRKTITANRLKAYRERNISGNSKV